MKRSTGALVGIAITTLAISIPLTFFSHDGTSPGGNNHAAEEQNTESAPSKPSEVYEPALPLADFSISRQQQVLLDRAQIKAQESCVRRLGGADLPVREVPDATTARESSRRYGLMDLESARQHGYQAPDQILDSESRPQPSPTQIMLLSGQKPSGERLKTFKSKPVPAGGCSAEARRLVYGNHDEEPGIAVAQRIDIEGYKLSLQEPRLTTAFSSWSQCMKRTGYAYTSPLTVTDDPDFSDADPSDKERAVAQADVACKVRLRLPQTWEAIETAIQSKMIKENYVVLTQLRQDQERMVRKAKSILQSG